MQLLPWVLAKGAPMVLKSTPAEAVLSLDMTVLLMMLTFRASNKEIPAPSQPATLLVMMLLVTSTEFHRAGVVGKLTTSAPLVCCKARPPPLPLSAWLPMIRLALITKLGPVPSLGPIEPGGGTQSVSTWTRREDRRRGRPLSGGRRRWLRWSGCCSD